MSESRVPELLAVTIVLLMAVLFFVPARLYTRVVIMKAFGIDDGIMVLSLALHTVNSIFIFLGCSAGLGRHFQELDLKEIIDGLMYNKLIQIMYILQSFVIKASIAFSILRIMLERRYICAVWFGLAIAATTGIVAFYYSVTDCSPISYNWAKVKPTAKGECRDPLVTTHVAYGLSAAFIFLDVLFVVVPGFVILNLRMSKRVRYTAMSIMSLGIFATIATMVRLKFLIQMANTADLLYAISDAIIWSVVECGLGMIAACALTLRPLLRHLRYINFLSSWTDKTQSSAIGRSVRLPDWPSNATSTVNTTGQQNGADFGSEEEILESGILRNSDIRSEESNAAGPNT